MFSYAASLPAARGRAARLTPYVPRWVPVLGPKVWGGADLYWKQQLAPHFLEAWEEFAHADETADLKMLRQSAVGGAGGE